MVPTYSDGSKLWTIQTLSNTKSLIYKDVMENFIIQMYPKYIIYVVNVNLTESYKYFCILEEI